MRINWRLIIKSALYFIITVFFLVLQNNLLQDIPVFRVTPNFILCCAVAAAVLETGKYSAVYAFIAGFVADCAFSSPFMFSGLLLFLYAYSAEYVKRVYMRKSLLSMLILMLPALVLRGLLNFFYTLGIWRNFSAPDLLLKIILPEFVLTFIVSPLVYFIIKYTSGRLNYKI